MSIVDDEMTAEELLDSIRQELLGYAEKKWQPARVRITAERIRTLADKIQASRELDEPTRSLIGFLRMFTVIINDVPDEALGKFAQRLGVVYDYMRVGK